MFNNWTPANERLFNDPPDPRVKFALARSFVRYAPMDTLKHGGFPKTQTDAFTIQLIMRPRLRNIAGLGAYASFQDVVNMLAE